MAKPAVIAKCIIKNLCSLFVKYLFSSLSVFRLIWSIGYKTYTHITKTPKIGSVAVMGIQKFLTIIRILPTVRHDSIKQEWNLFKWSPPAYDLSGIKNTKKRMPSITICRYRNMDIQNKTNSPSSIDTRKPYSYTFRSVSSTVPFFIILWVKSLYH